MLYMHVELFLNHMMTLELTGLLMCTVFLAYPLCHNHNDEKIEPTINVVLKRSITSNEVRQLDSPVEASHQV